MTLTQSPAPLESTIVDDLVKRALAEDLGLKGDITTKATVDADEQATADITARQSGVVSGIAVAIAAFQQLDPAVSCDIKKQDGACVEAGDIIATVNGPARAILTAERVALNFLGHMSAIATLTRRYVDAVHGTRAKIVDTRKTTPGLRAIEKYAVTCGGGQNHRSGLFDAVLIKDNHIVAAGGIEPAIERAKSNVGHMTKIEVEVDTLTQLEAALHHPIDAVLLDNMTPQELKAAVERVAGRVVTEASGGVTLETVADIAATGVEMISIGALTHSAPVFDIGLDFQE